MPGRYEEAYPRLRELASAGDGWANLHLGWMYQRGLACPIDLAKAEGSYLRAYERGISEAPYYLGRLYRGKKQYQDALRYLEEAASKGNPSAAYWTYLMYSDGEGVAQDSHKAMQFLEKATALGHIFAKRDLAKRTMRGEFGLRRIPWGPVVASCERLYDCSNRGLKSRRFASKVAIRLLHSRFARRFSPTAAPNCPGG